MKGKILFVTGLAVGYVLGTRAGRERYEQIKVRAAKVWGNPQVQERVETVENFVKDKTPEVAGFVVDGVKKVAGTVSSIRGGSDTTAKKPATKKAPAKKPAAKKAPAKKPASSTSGSKSGGSSASDSDA